ncbi:hypothetical protein LCGC14_1009610 [marine sediment metagenome]|uniref:Uncharacterized protein n=1 Tax=marine sediment metagenome TaxID=412755 RepID=A0A0F9R6Q5_9ZZZZ|nr:hypothetical protein [Pricia sp.]
MKLCKWDKCDNEARQKSLFCGGTCKKRYARSGTDVPVGAQVGQSDKEFVEFSGVRFNPLTSETKKSLDQPDLSSLPPGVSRPIGQPTTNTAKMPAPALARKVSLYKGLAWLDSPEYAEVIFRLLSRTIDQLKTARQFIPVWRPNEEMYGKHIRITDAMLNKYA